MPADQLNVTLIQPDIVWEDKEANRKQYETYIAGIKEQRGVVVLPEMFTTGFSMGPEGLAETMDGPSIQWMKAMASKYRCILTGSLITEENGSYYNRLVWMQPDGHYGIYDKRHLFAHAGEDEHYASGNKKLLVSVNGWKICPLICYDLRFPVWSRNSLPPAPSNGGGASGANDEFYASADPTTYGKLKEFMLIHRKQPTKAENILWQGLRSKQLEGYKFRRQHIIGNYIADFVCLSKKMIIEVDGLVHQLPENTSNDQERTEWLEEQGYIVVRFTNDQVINQYEQTLSVMQEKLHQLPFAERKHLSNPPSVGGSGREAYDILLYVANWPERRSLAWKTLLQARAIENQAFVVGVNRVGVDGNGINYSGDSSVFGPLGEMVWQNNGDVCVQTITLEKQSLYKVRSELPFLRDADSFILL